MKDAQAIKAATVRNEDKMRTEPIVGRLTKSNMARTRTSS